MKNFFLIIIIFSLLVIAGCKTKTDSTQDIFYPITSQQYSDKITLEEGYKIILPYIKKWSDDAILQGQRTNIINPHNNFKIIALAFDSINRKSTLYVTFNYKQPIDENKEGAPGDPESWEDNKKFYFKETQWPANIDGSRLNEIKNNFKQSKYNNIENYLTSEKIIELSKNEGLYNFLKKYPDLMVTENQVYMVEYDNDIKWNVVVAGKENNIDKTSHIFILWINPLTGEILKKMDK